MWFNLPQVNIRNRKKADGSNNWEYRFEGASINGKRKQISKSGFKTKREALEQGTKALAEYNRSGNRFEPSEISVADFLDYWFDNYVKINCKYHTQEVYAGVIKNHLKPSLGKYRLKSLTPSVCQEWVNKMFLQSGLSKHSLTNIVTTLSGALKYAVEPARFIESSPMVYVKPPHSTEPTKKTNRIIISNDSFNRMCDRFEGTPFYYALMIGFYTGMRIGEVYGLTWDDIDFDRHTITVNRLIVKRNYGLDVRKAMNSLHKKEEKSSWYISTLKTKSSYRTIKIGQTLVDALKHYKDHQRTCEAEYGEYYIQHHLKPEKDEKGQTIFRIIPCAKLIGSSLPTIDLVFRSDNGSYSSTDSFKYASRVIHHELGIEFNFHSLRHTHATRLIEAGVSPKVVQTRLGHADIQTTLQTYTHTTDSMEQDAVESFEEVMSTK